MPARRSHSSLPLVLVGALSLAAIVPHLSQPKTTADARAASDGGVSASTPLDAKVGAETAITDLLADQFQVDVSTRGLRSRIDEAVRVLNAGSDPNAVRDSASLLGAFLCGEPDRRGDQQQKRARQVAWRLSGGRSNFVPCGTVSDRPSPVSSAEKTSLVRYVESRLGVDSFDNNLLVRTVLHASVDGAFLRFLIATVPDPVDSYETWQFDPMLDALRQAIEHSNHTFQRFQFPDVAVEQRPQASASGQRELHRHWPGVVVFTNKNEPEILVLFLVPETPTAGIHHEPFERSIDFAASWIREETELSGAARSGLIGVVGPSFSGSTRSLAKAFQLAERALAKLPCEPIRVISGNASNFDNKAILENAINIDCPRPDQPPRPNQIKRFGVQFYATVHPNEAMRHAVTQFKKRIGIVGPMATISENTAFGQVFNADLASAVDEQPQKDVPDPESVADQEIQITVPYNIAQLREGATPAVRQAAALGAVLPSVRPLPLEDLVIPTDQPVVRTPQTMAAYVELVVRNMIDTIRRRRIRAVQIAMTDVRDRLFLAKELAQRAPDLMVFVIDGDLFYGHPEQYPWTRNLIVFSSYPLHSPGSGPPPHIHQFANVGSQGVYNATLALLDSGDTASLSPLATTRLTDYTPSTCDGRATENPPSPPVWISVVARGALWPVNAEPVCDSRSASYMFPGLSRSTTADVRQTAASNPQPAPPSGQAASSETQVAATTMTIGVLVGIVICIGVLGFAAARYVLKPELAALLGICVGAVLIAVTVLNSPNLGLGAALFLSAVAPVLFAWPALRSDLRNARMEAALTVVLWVPFGLYLWEVAHASNTFQERLFEIENGVSPLLPMLLLAAIPLLLWTIVMRHRFLQGGTADRAPVAAEQWAQRTVDVLGRVMLGGLTGRVRTRFTSLYSTLFYLPIALRIVVWIALGLFAIIVFDFRQATWSLNEWSPVWSVNGIRFGWLVFAGIMVVQLVLMVALVQFLLQWLACANVLRALAQHELAPAYKLVTKSLIPQSLVPKRLHLDHLQVVLEEMRKAGVDIKRGEELLVAGVQEDIRQRWFASPVWTEFIQGKFPQRPVTHSSDADRKRATWVATAAVVIVRGLLSRLTLSLITLCSCVAILMGLQATLSFQGSHRLLAVIWVDVITVVVVVIGAFIQMDMDETLSLVTNTEPGEVTWNFDLLSKIAVYAVLPVLLLFVSQFPSLGVSIADLFNSMPSIP